MILTTQISKETTWNDIVKNGANTGDEINIILKDGKEIVFRAHHDRKGGLYFITRDLPWSCFMNDEGTTDGGYPACDARKWIIEEVVPLFPEEMLEVIEPLRIKQIIGGITIECVDTFWIPSLKQVFGSEDPYCTEPEDLPLDGFETEVKRVKGKIEDGETWYWWLRSADSAYNFRCVYGSGGDGDDYANLSYRFPLGFKAKSLSQ